MCLIMNSQFDHPTLSSYRHLKCLFIIIGLHTILTTFLNAEIVHDFVEAFYIPSDTINGRYVSDGNTTSKLGSWSYTHSFTSGDRDADYGSKYSVISTVSDEVLILRSGTNGSGTAETNLFISITESGYLSFDVSGADLIVSGDGVASCGLKINNIDIIAYAQDSPGYDNVNFDPPQPLQIARSLAKTESFVSSYLEVGDTLLFFTTVRGASITPEKFTTSARLIINNSQFTTAVIPEPTNSAIFLTLVSSLTAYIFSRRLQNIKLHIRFVD
jgi:hypothetical protein